MRDPLPKDFSPGERATFSVPQMGREEWRSRGDAELEDEISQNRPNFRYSGFNLGSSVLSVIEEEPQKDLKKHP